MHLVSLGIVWGLLGLLGLAVGFVVYRVIRKKTYQRERSWFGGKHDRPAAHQLKHLEARSGFPWRSPFR
ncbi:MAG: hypothetical protein ETSY1_34250 [Candidatus Entotheonella factor]|uniref:Uncharacterized protein n=1 Tax=Entotheonella factor TaxID=1429438 RepID=W4L918_ENTF1|nr:MAG: hypothetical protein ETSY1_34250 [Candidatus Entotheonella factor]